MTPDTRGGVGEVVLALIAVVEQPQMLLGAIDVVLSRPSDPVVVGMACRAIVHYLGDCSKGLAKWFHGLIPFGAGDECPLDCVRSGLDDTKQYSGRTVGNRPPLLPLLHGADAEAEPTRETSLR